MSKKELEKELNENKKKNLSYRARLDKIIRLIEEYEETDGNAFTYMRKISNVIKYYDTKDYSEDNAQMYLKSHNGINFEFERVK